MEKFDFYEECHQKEDKFDLKRSRRKIFMACLLCIVGLCIIGGFVKYFGTSSQAAGTETTKLNQTIKSESLSSNEMQQLDEIQSQKNMNEQKMVEAEKKEKKDNKQPIAEPVENEKKENKQPNEKVQLKSVHYEIENRLEKFQETLNSSDQTTRDRIKEFLQKSALIGIHIDDELPECDVSSSSWNITRLDAARIVLNQICGVVKPSLSDLFLKIEQEGEEALLMYFDFLEYAKKKKEGFLNEVISFNKIKAQEFSISGWTGKLKNSQVSVKNLNQPLKENSVIILHSEYSIMGKFLQKPLLDKHPAFLVNPELLAMMIYSQNMTPSEMMLVENLSNIFSSNNRWSSKFPEEIIPSVPKIFIHGATFKQNNRSQFQTYINEEIYKVASACRTWNYTAYSNNFEYSSADSLDPYFRTCIQLIAIQMADCSIEFVQEQGLNNSFVEKVVGRYRNKPLSLYNRLIKAVQINNLSIKSFIKTLF